MSLFFRILGGIVCLFLNWGLFLQHGSEEGIQADSLIWIMVMNIILIPTVITGKYLGFWGKSKKKENNK